MKNGYRALSAMGNHLKNYWKEYTAIGAVVFGLSGCSGYKLSGRKSAIRLVSTKEKTKSYFKTVFDRQLAESRKKSRNAGVNFMRNVIEDGNDLDDGVLNAMEIINLQFEHKWEQILNSKRQASHKRVSQCYAKLKNLYEAKKKADEKETKKEETKKGEEK